MRVGFILLLFILLIVSLTLFGNAVMDKLQSNNTSINNSENKSLLADISRSTERLAVWDTYGPATIGPPDLVMYNSVTEYMEEGNKCYDNGDFAGAVRFYELAIQESDLYRFDDPCAVGDIWLNLGTAYFKQGKYEEAIIAYNKAVSINPESSKAQKMVNECLKKINQTT
ncbi:tetratricopeptide repeat protein [Candidatus Pacearchaeota archaeon]|jgi:tetratricopeptide (TPR) repeat protein|nr:tetratricopeptide repeat protein [Candidatus Pacearchaeota archaeon]